ncbi:hypothetical protein M0R45_020531 [Rubus argutus]|uniref:Uncharacterized protein n=1 Tax=Rubus argutus TaxID=59490 RepID=A0AAW1X8P2_RUBAR
MAGSMVGKIGCVLGPVTSQTHQQGTSMVALAVAGFGPVGFKSKSAFGLGTLGLVCGDKRFTGGYCA